MNKPSRVVIIGEDDMHLNFVRRYLYRTGIERHQIFSTRSPFARGAGDQWVRENYTKEVRAYRSRSKKAETALIVVIDADNFEVTERLLRFGRALEENELPPRANNEQIIHFIPKRNIETWLCCLNGEVVDEIEDCKKINKKNTAAFVSSITRAAETLFHWSRPNASIPKHCIPSLSIAIVELRRLES